MLRGLRAIFLWKELGSFEHAQPLTEHTLPSLSTGSKKRSHTVEFPLLEYNVLVGHPVPLWPVPLGPPLLLWPTVAGKLQWRLNLFQ